MTSSKSLSPEGKEPTLDVIKAAKRLGDVGHRPIDVRGSLGQGRGCGQGCNAVALCLFKQGALVGGKALKS